MIDSRTPERITLVKKHPLAIRWLHWVNFPVLAIMLWSGLLILWANDVYPTEAFRLRVPDTITYGSFGVRAYYSGQEVPEGVRSIAIGFRLAEGMAWHFAFAWLFLINGLAYVLYLAISGQWRHLAPRRDSLIGAVKVALHDLTHWRGPRPPEGVKYNDAQRIAYCGVLLLSAGMALTGVAIWKPAQLAWLVRLLGGYPAARLEHFLITGLLVAFFLVHVVQVMRAGWNALRAMLTGWEAKS